MFLVCIYTLRPDSVNACEPHTLNVIGCGVVLSTVVVKNCRAEFGMVETDTLPPHGTLVPFMPARAIGTVVVVDVMGMAVVTATQLVAASFAP